MDDWSRGKTAVAVAVLAVGFSAPALLTGIAFALGDGNDGGSRADTDSYPVMQCPRINAEHTNSGVLIVDQVCYVENAANVEGELGASY